MTGLLLADEAAGVGAQLSQSLLLLAIAAAVGVPYFLGTRRLLAASRLGSWAWRSWAWRRYAFLAGELVAMVAVAPTLDPIVDASFVLHMCQHLVLMFAAAPLLALGAPGLPWLLALPIRWRRRVTVPRSWPAVRQVRAVAAMPIVAVAVYTVVIVAWHASAIFTAALENDTVHEAEHASFLFAAWWLWAPLAAPHRPVEGGRGVLYMFVSGFPMIGVGAALVMAPRPLYPAQTGTGPGALAAQQTAGVIMWVPPTFLAVGFAAVLMLTWFRRLERATPAGAQLPPPIPPPLPAAAPRAHGRRSR